MPSVASGSRTPDSACSPRSSHSFSGQEYQKWISALLRATLLVEYAAIERGFYSGKLVK
jgi:hypothetical protein